jgi:hypothetical protein
MEGARARDDIAARRERPTKNPGTRDGVPGVEIQTTHRNRAAPMRESQAKLITGRSSGFRVNRPPRLPTPRSREAVALCGDRHRLQRRVRGRFSRPSLLISTKRVENL